MIKKLLYFSSVVLVAFILNGCSIKARIKKADKQFAMGEYYKAGDNYKRILRKVPGKNKSLRARLIFNEAECYRVLNFNNAQQIYATAIRNGYPDSIVYLRYAQVLQRNGDYKAAVKNYAIYLHKDSTDVQAENGLKILEEVEKYKSQPTQYLVKKDKLFNARHSSTFSPAFQSDDGDVLFFTSNRAMSKKVLKSPSAITGMPLNALFYVKKNAEGKWLKPELLPAEINVENTDNGACAFSSDGNTLYYTHAQQEVKSETGTEIYVSNRAGGTWSTPKKLEIFKDSTISVAHPALSPDNSTLYFVSDAPGGQGGKDIWKATLDNGECKNVENLGKDINTPGDEMFPTVRYNGDLYFSSNGRGGLGGLDIYVAKQNPDSSWTVHNMGIPINSHDDDFGMTFEGKKEKGYFSSNRGERRGFDAIWSFEIPTYEYYLQGKVVDDGGNPVPEATIRMVSNNGMNVKVQARKNGTYRMKLEKNIDCVMMASARGYLNNAAQLSTMGAKQSKTYTQDFTLLPIYKPIQIQNIFYEFGKWNLTAASEAGLQSLVKILKDNPNISIELGSHTDYVGDNESNKILSEKRAQSVVDYLIKAGIDKDRLTSVGYGEDKPFVVDAATAKKYPFLKENDVLTEDFVSKLTPAQQEIANQINRRTEFRVVKMNYK